MIKIKQFLTQVFHFFIHTNLLITAAASAQCALTYFIFQQPINYTIVLVEGSATLLLYNFSLYLSKPKQPALSPYLRTRWVFSHLWILYMLSACAALVLGYALKSMTWKPLLFLLGIAVFSVLYSFPLWKKEGHWVGLRQIPYIKLFHIAFVWVFSSVCLPYMDLYDRGIAISINLLITLAVLKFIFLIICTLPFDIRDIKQDSYYHLKTLPSVWGEQRAKNLCYLLLGAHSILIIFAPYAMLIKIGLLMTNLFIALCLQLLVFKKQGHYHYAYLLDFALVWQFIAVAFWQLF